jgi:hypothetical protein
MRALVLGELADLDQLLPASLVAQDESRRFQPAEHGFIRPGRRGTGTPRP